MGERLLTATTCWVFVSSSGEERHLSDIVFAVDVLRKRGVPDEKILVFTDHPQATLHLAPYALAANAHPLGRISTVLAGVTGASAIVMVVTGHGSEEGLPSAPPINGTQLLAAARGCPGIEFGVLIVGQCFAGVFNYLKVDDLPAFCILGATNLHSSLSSRVELGAPIQTSDGSTGLREWSANIFLVRFFEWFHKPRDIDGDGRFTLMDAYRHSGATSNSQLRKLKREAHVEVGILQLRVADLIANRVADPRWVIALQALQAQLQVSLETLYLHQEPWVLNARLAARIEV